MANPDSGIADKVVIVTGGTKGIGKQIAQSFLKEKAKVIICARNQPQETIQDGESNAYCGLDWFRSGCLRWLKKRRAPFFTAEG